MERSTRFSGDPEYLKRSQYRSGGNLTARVNLHNVYSTNPYGWQRWVLEQIPLAPEMKVIELGCGIGSLWSANAERIPKMEELVLTDFSPGLVGEVQQKVGAVIPQATFAVVDACNIPYPDARFDIVIANHMLYHLPERSKAIAEIARVLQPKGCLVAATNGVSHLQELDELIAACVSGSERDDTAVQFGLESGRDQLASHFGSVEVRRYRDSLQITDVDPVVAYIASLQPEGALKAAEADCIRATVIATSLAGAFHVTKDAGLFVCHK